MENRTDIGSLYLNELEEYITGLSEKKFRAAQIFDWLHSKLAKSAADMNNISKELKAKIEEQCYIPNLSVVTCLESELDGTKKYLFAFQDGNTVESVLMRYKHGNSVCISSQVGCRMGCAFCASTLDGRVRDLTASEMLSEVYEIVRQTGERISNIVIMGSGEPLDNYANLIRFINLVADPKGMNISKRNITVSTCGLVPKIRELAKEKLPVTLAISLHAPNDDIRKKMMPVAKKYSMDELLSACDDYFNATGRRISFEYSLVKGENDSVENATELAKKLKGKNAHVNLIPINPIKEREYQKPDNERIQRFKNTLEKYQINVTIRREMGSDIQAACGQLRRGHIKSAEE